MSFENIFVDFYFKLQLTQELGQQKKLKDTVKQSAVIEIEELEANIYKNSVEGLMDLYENLAKYFEEGTRLCKRTAQDIQIGKEDFEVNIRFSQQEIIINPLIYHCYIQTHLKDRSRGKVPSSEMKLSMSEFKNTGPTSTVVDPPPSAKKKEKLKSKISLAQFFIQFIYLFS